VDWRPRPVLSYFVEMRLVEEESLLGLAWLVAVLSQPLLDRTISQTCPKNFSTCPQPKGMTHPTV
jgi:hypothetical protein